eukprot:TRINITY_DN20028_c0_g1_i2.p1 TRINITY_DN20028_c0_g1~~TRINITY_DN20028_c0_g1_i2.p1  ORF type:complete len:290 (-),score=37.30 TRINITY_DN20028_c0_g1_i2:51-920(-)
MCIRDRYQRRVRGGFNGNANSYDTKNGYQMDAIYRMIKRIAGKFVQIPPPSGLQVTSTNDSSVSLSWGAVSGATGYNIYQSAGKANTEAITVTDYTVAGLQSGTQYSFSATSLQGNAESVHSTTTTGTTTGTPPPLQPPTNLRSASETSSSISLLWTASQGASDYNVYRDNVRVNANGIIGEEYQDTGLQPEMSYSYFVKAMDTLGVESAASNQISVTTRSAWVCQSYRVNNYQQVQDGRAYTTGGNCFANGSDDPMGLYNLAVVHTLSETASGYFIVGECPSAVPLSV